MADLKPDNKLHLQMSPNPLTNEVEILIRPTGINDEHGWFCSRVDLIELLSTGQVVVPHAKKGSDIVVPETNIVVPPGSTKQ